jgi:hypothetical protein
MGPAAKVCRSPRRDHHFRQRRHPLDSVADCLAPWYRSASSRDRGITLGSGIDRRKPFSDSMIRQTPIQRQRNSRRTSGILQSLCISRRTAASSRKGSRSGGYDRLSGGASLDDLRNVARKAASTPRGGVVRGDRAAAAVLKATSCSVMTTGCGVTASSTRSLLSTAGSGSEGVTSKSATSRSSREVDLSTVAHGQRDERSNALLQSRSDSAPHYLVVATSAATSPTSFRSRPAPGQ